MLAFALMFFAVSAISNMLGLAAVAAVAATMATTALAIGLFGFALTLLLAIRGRTLIL